LRQIQARGAALSETGTSTAAGSDSRTSHVAAAQSRYRSLQQQRGIASASADPDDAQDGDGASVLTRSSTHSAGSGGSAVEAIKARYAQMRAESSSAASQSSAQPSLVEQVKARYRASQGEEHASAAGTSAHEDDASTVLTQSTTGSRASQVDLARAKYMRLRELRQQALGSDTGSVRSGGSSSTGSSLVEAARARGEALKRSAAESASRQEEGESDGQTVMSQSQAPSSQQSYAYSDAAADSGNQPSYMVSAIKARYQASAHRATSRVTSTHSTSAYSSSAYPASDYSVGQETSGAAGSGESVAAASQARSQQSYTEASSAGIAAQDDDSTSHKSTASGSVDSARSAAMSKFAFYKAKAEAEAAQARALSEQDSGVAVRLKERVVPLRRPESEWTMDDASEALTAMSVGDERSAAPTAAPAAVATASSGSSAEDLKARAMARAKEKYARAKELAAQDKAATSMGAAGSAEGRGRSSAVEEAMRRLKESQNIPGPSADQLPPPPAFGATTTVLHHSKTSSTSRTVTDNAAHSLNADADLSVTREATRAAQPRTTQP
jgi:hypothetical protein